MLQRLVANWLRQHAQDAVYRTLHPETADDEVQAIEPTRAEIACVFPTAAEAGGLVDKLSSLKIAKCSGFVERVGEFNGKPIAVVETHGSQELLARVVRDVIAVHQPKWVVVSGFAMAVVETIGVGDIVVASRVVDQHDYSLSTGMKMPEARGLWVGAVLTADGYPESTRNGDTLNAGTAVAIEGQAAVVAEVCRITRTKMMAVHVVAQTIDARPSRTVERIKEQGSLASTLGAAAGAFIHKPSSALEFWQDKEATLRLSDRLASFLEGMLKQL